MSRSSAARRRRDNGHITSAGAAGVVFAGAGDDDDEQGESLGVANARLRDELSEVEGWYRLLLADHSTLEGRMARSDRRVTELQAEANRLTVENQELHTLVSRFVPRGAGRVGNDAPAGRDQGQLEGQGLAEGEDFAMRRIFDWSRSAQRHKWATAAVVTIATLLARDPGVQGFLVSAAGRVRQAVAGSGAGEGQNGADSGFLRYAAMIQSREQLERARREYNENESRLRGDALLEAQDRLRAAKIRDRQAKLAFLPELVRQCDQARLPVPREAAETLAALHTETVD